jgi:RNA 3'-terminal phosphate cyclase (ATP)
MIEINGEMGEGGGQLLRGALALAAATGGAFRIQRIRARRPKAGLMRQHLTAVRAAAAICGAEVEGAELGSTELTFRAGAARAGDHVLDIGSAGSASLVLQAIVPALAQLDAPSTIAITGGTHNPMAPPFDFVARVLAPQLAAIGWSIELALARPGFAPAGGGRVEARIGPARALRPLTLVERGARRSHEVRAVVVNLPRAIAERELEVVRQRLNWDADAAHVVELRDGGGGGNCVAITIAFEHVTEVFTAIGELRKPAEQIAANAAHAARAYLRATAPAGEHLCDQLLVPLALAAGGELRAMAWSGHAEAQRLLLRAWFARDVEVTRADDGVRVRVPAMTA